MSTVVETAENYLEQLHIPKIGYAILNDLGL